MRRSQNKGPEVGADRAGLSSGLREVSPTSPPGPGGQRWGPARRGRGARGQELPPAVGYNAGNVTRRFPCHTWTCFPPVKLLLHRVAAGGDAASRDSQMCRKLPGASSSESHSWLTEAKCSGTSCAGLIYLQKYKKATTFFFNRASTVFWNILFLLSKQKTRVSEHGFAPIRAASRAPSVLCTLMGRCGSPPVTKPALRLHRKSALTRGSPTPAPRLARLAPRKASGPSVFSGRSFTALASV